MKLNSTQILRVLFFSVLIACLYGQGFAQVNGLNYTYGAAANPWAANSGTIFAGSPGADEVVFMITPTAAQWSGFTYGSKFYPSTTTIYVSTNGWLSFVNQGGALPNNSLSTTPVIIAPLWDDLKVSAAGNINWKITGASPTRRLIVEWNQMLWDHNATIQALSFQVTLYENSHTTPNVIDVKFLNNGTGTTNVNNGSGGASAGISGFCPGDFYSYQFPPGSGAPVKTAEATNLNSHPLAANIFKLTPVAHPNDDCASAFNMGSFNAGLSLISLTGTTLHSTQTAGAPSCGGPPASWSDVWFTFTKPANITNFELFTDSQDCRGASFSTGIEVFNACPVVAPLACDFGSAGPAGTNATSYLNFTNQPCAATQYWVRVYTTDVLNKAYFRFNIRPPGRDCAFANDITGCGLTYNSPAGLSTCGFDNDYDSLYAMCHSRVQHGEDYVFSYTPPVNQCVNFTLNNTAANSNPGLFIYANGCPSPNTGPTGSEVCYGNASSAGGSPLQFNNVTLTGGQTYYFVVDYDSSGATPCLSNFALNILNLGASPPTNDVCSGSQNVPITISSACVGSIDYNNNCATPSAAGTVPAPGCASFTDGVTPDVWFNFTSAAVVTGPYQTNIDVGTIPSAQDLAMAIYQGTCAGLALVTGACDDNSNGLMPSLSFTPLPSTTYYVRIWSNNGTRPGNFRICVLSGCTPPNDLCAGVITLQNNQPKIGDNGCSTGTLEPNNGSLSGVSASCWVNTGGAGQLHTVWYNFVATNTQMRVRLRLLTMFDSQIALYSSSTGTCAGVFTQIFCNNDGPNICGTGGTNRWSEITATGLTVGNTYFLRVDGTNANTGTFELTLVEGTTAFPPINVQDCALAQSICSGSNFVLADPGYQGTGNICDMPNGGSTCMASGERGSSWFTWSVTGAAGTGTYMNFIINPNSPTDYDFVLYVIDTVTNGGDGIPAVANYCSQLTNAAAFPAIACNWSACGNTGCNQSAGTLNIPGGNFQGGAGAPCIIPAILVPPGMTATFLLQSSNFTTSTAGFTLNFQGTPINTTPPNMIWTGSANTTTWGQVLNWNPSNCGSVPSCVNLIPAFIGTGAYQPTIVANTNVKDLTINPGATLTIAASITLQVCGNFTNNGTLVCGSGANITFIGSAAQFISGTFAAASNQFYNLVVNKSGGTLTFNTDIYCQGNFTVSSGIVNFNSKNLEVGGNFYNVNGPTSITGLGTGPAGTTISFTRRSTVNQLYQNDGANLTLNNVSMRQLLTGGTLTLNANATSDLIIGINGVLSMGTGVGVGQHGVIVTGAREVNVLNSAATACNAGSASSYVSGKLRRAIATGINSYDFPVGDLLKGYELANINYTTGPTSGYNLLAQFKIWGGSNCAFPAGFGPTASECVTATYDALPYFNHGYWNIDASVAGATGTYDATMYNVGMTNNTGMGWTLVKAASGSCSFGLTGNCYIPSTAAQTRRTGLTGFSDFATVQSQTPLPVELLSFEAKANHSGVLCSWVTATETNNDHFDLERSTNGTSFKKIGEMKGYGAGTSVHNMEYKYQDDDICTGTVYYRLKQVDIDGRYSYSEVAAVVCKSSLVTVAPNPAHNSFNLTFYEPLAGNVTVEVTDIIGQVMMTKVFEVERGFNERTIDVASFANGIYYVKITSGDSQAGDVTKTIKFLKY
jgi:hypothetical protein